MTAYIDQKYLHLLAPHLSQFKRKKDNLWNFRCPYCGDSQSSSTKARGYVYQHEAQYNFKCHNCGYGTTLKKLIQDTDPELYKQYLMENFSIRERREPTKKKMVLRNTPKYIRTEFKSLKKISQLKPNHPAKRYVEKRSIPTKFHHKIFYATKFYQFVNELIPNKFSIQKDESRIILPFLDENKKLFGFQGRALGPSKTKYITIMLDESRPKVFGLDNIDKHKKVYVVEGPIDSLFVNNCIAMAGADLSNLHIPNSVIVYDNEPRNREILNRMEKTISKGHNIVIWPDYINEKDINDMVLTGKTTEDIMGVLRENTYSSLKAKIKLSEWRKV